MPILDRIEAKEVLDSCEEDEADEWKEAYEGPWEMVKLPEYEVKEMEMRDESESSSGSMISYHEIGSIHKRTIRRLTKSRSKTP